MSAYVVLVFILQMLQESPLESQDKSTQYETVYPELVATFSGMFLADIVLLPFETVLHRLYLQGTRVLTDNMDHGRQVLGVQFQYNGFLDCVWQIMCDEGLSGFYRGLGALVLQYLCQFVGLKVLEYVLLRLNGMNNGTTSRKRVSRTAQYPSEMMVF